MPLIAKGDHDGAATVDELLHDLVEDMIQALPTGEGVTTVFRRPTAFCRPTGRLRRPHRVRREGSPHRFCRCDVTPDPRGRAAHRRS
ncbi:hypothetical protein ADL01_21555 [Streptomyces sp. NRRL WC-3618]|uniref:hypothetical protein n=1 Tax=Streptomyces sp. NRRL WC-3618 TaxID=1519490 RepID=UPI0006B05334|nr:hypothetical protein [Streptomyces sp. NRRL WC-3618]KOV69965.1 hypothetical protein ADL01_21555 [Streptomyces sp. NRRL WC-3618]